jgi:xylulokinase
MARAWYIGLDIGTSAVKALLLETDGTTERAIGEAEAAVSSYRPQPGWSEQQPADWEQAVERALADLRRQVPDAYGAVAGLGLSGQMHGLVALDRAGQVIRPAILWNDGRASAESAELNRGIADLGRRTGVPAMPGFTSSKLLWLARHEPDCFSRIRHLLLSKDVVRLNLTGDFVTDMSDAAGTGLLDEAARDWYGPAVSACLADRAWLPRLAEGSDAAGRMLPAIAEKLGFSGPVTVAGGAGDAAAAAIGIGAVEDCDSFLSLGTSAQYFVTTAAYRPYPEALIHAFAHALPGRWFQMGAMLNGASCLGWLADIVGRGNQIGTLLAEAETQGRRPSPLLFLPYLVGERTPHDDPAARGVFFGLSAETTVRDMVMAVLEGVAFSLADAQDALAKAGAAPGPLALVGGGSRSHLWAEIIASVLDRPIRLYDGGAKGPALGAARLARMAVEGLTAAEACRPPPLREVVSPLPSLRDRYAARLPHFRDLYGRLRPAFAAFQSELA